MENEIWKDIPNYEGYYQASSLGNIKSMKRILKCSNGDRFKKEMLLKCSVDAQGYLNCCLCKDGDCKTIKVHRLIALTFLDNPNELPEVDHLDRVRINARLDNLEWVSRIDNVHRALDRDKTSQYIGVSLCKRGNKYRAEIQINSKKIHLGTFDTPYNAMIARTNYELKNNMKISNPNG